jgi:large subunit ribosomal protein L4
MPKVAVRTQTGGEAGSVDLDDAVFGIEPNIPVMHQVVTAQLAAARSGTQSTKTRAEVRGGGAKPWRQKGTGRARQGSIRSPQWRGGGVALGPKPRSYSQRTPKKMKRLALRSALSDRAAQDRVLVVDEWSFETPRTKDALAALSSLDLEGRILLVLGDDDVNAAKSFRNLQQVHAIRASELNTYDVLVSDWVVFSKATVPAQRAPAPAAAAPVDPESAAPETAAPETAAAATPEAEESVATADETDEEES